MKPMTIRPILTVPDKILKQVSKPVDKVTSDTRALMDDMLETMYDAPGIGLAAVQIGVPLNIIVMDLAREEEEPRPQYFVNPEILEMEDEVLANAGVDVFEEVFKLIFTKLYDEYQASKKYVIDYVES